MAYCVQLLIFNKRFSIKLPTILIMILLAGTFFRFYNLTYESLWLDEIFSMRGSDPDTSIADVYEYSKKDQPPLFFVVLYGWLKVFGYTDFAGRALTCLYGIAAIPVMYYLGKEIKDEKVGLLSAFFTAINWFHIGISKEIRFYPLVFLLTSLSYLFFIKAAKGYRIKNFILYAVFTGLLLNTHYYGLVVFASQFLIFCLVAIFLKKNRRFLWGGVSSGVFAAMMVFHWLPVIFSDLQISSFHVRQVGLLFPFEFAWAYIRDPVAFAIFALSVILLLIRLLKSGRPKLRMDHLVVIGWLFFSFMIPLVYSWVKIPLLTFNYSTIAVPAVLLIIASAFAFITDEKVRSFSLMAITISGIIVLFFARPPFKHRRAEDWRDVGAYFSSRRAEHQVIFSQLAWFHEYYFRKFDAPIPRDQNVVDFFELTKDKDRVWLLLNSRYTGGWPVSGFLEDQADFIEKEFHLRDSIMFKQTKAILYTRK